MLLCVALFTYITFLTYIQGPQVYVCELPMPVLLKTDLVLYFENLTNIL
jgi:hypothetical protein